jgi:hypothetical protein
MFERRHVLVLRQLYRGLKDTKVSWAVTASLNLALHGLPVEVHDVDILSDEAGVYEIERLFSQHSVQPVRWRVSERLRSHFGVLRIAGVDVEIMGALEFRSGVDSWEATPEVACSSEIIELEGMPIPVRALEAEYAAYLRLGRREKARLLRAWLRTH